MILMFPISKIGTSKVFFTIKGYYVDIMNLKENVKSLNGDDVFQLLSPFYHR